jgi:hypothetical protein
MPQRKRTKRPGKRERLAAGKKTKPAKKTENVREDSTGDTINRKIRRIIKGNGTPWDVVKHKDIKPKHASLLKRAGYLRIGKGNTSHWFGNHTPIPKNPVLSKRTVREIIEAGKKEPTFSVAESNLSGKQRWTLWKSGWHRVNLKPHDRTPNFVWKPAPKKKKAA